MTQLLHLFFTFTPAANLVMEEFSCKSEEFNSQSHNFKPTGQSQLPKARIKWPKSVSYVLPGYHITAGWEASLVNTRLQFSSWVDPRNVNKALETTPKSLNPSIKPETFHLKDCCMWLCFTRERAHTHTKQIKSLASAKQLRQPSKTLGCPATTQVLKGQSWQIYLGEG